jgi:hypothetical protein
MERKPFRSKVETVCQAEGKLGDPQRAINIFREHAFRQPNPKAKRNLDRQAAQIAEEYNLKYTRLTKDPLPTRIIDKILRR